MGPSFILSTPSRLNLRLRTGGHVSAPEALTVIDAPPPEWGVLAIYGYLINSRTSDTAPFPPRAQ